MPARKATIPPPDQASRGPYSHPGVSVAEAKVPPEALNLHHRTREGHRAASTASQVGSVILGWLLWEVVVEPQGQLLWGQRDHKVYLL